MPCGVQRYDAVEREFRNRDHHSKHRYFNDQQLKFELDLAGNQHNYTQSGANDQLTSMSYDPTIAPGAILSGVAFKGSYSGTNTAPTAFYVNGTLCH